MLFTIKSKIHFESKSQQIFPVPLSILGCLPLSQRYILKANHNYALNDIHQKEVVYH